MSLSAIVIVGMSSVIGLTRVNYSDVEPPVGTCNVSHDTQDCVNDCRSRYVTDQCRCRLQWMEGKVPYCSLYQRLTCADIKLYQFQSSREWHQYCNCAPKCKRTDYEVTITSSQISKYAIGKQLHGSRLPPNNLVKIGRIQDWNYLNEANRSYTDTLYKLSLYMEPSGHCNFLKSILETSNLISSFMSLCSLQEICIKDVIDKCENIKSILHDVQMTTENLIRNVKASFFYVHDTSEPNDNTPDDFSVRSANDILRNNATHMKDFYSKVLSEIDLILLLVKQIENDVKDLTEWIGTNISDTSECDTKPYLVNMTTSNDFCNKYDAIKQNLTSMYTEYEKLYETIKNNTTLMNSHDWGFFHPEEFYQENYVELIIYFESLSTTKISQFETDSLNSLICDLGGNLGLWLGGSLLTLAEIIDLAIIIPGHRI